MLKAVLAIHLILVLGLIAGCGDSDKEFPAAEPGDLKTLQRLADSYTQLSTQLEASPVKLRPEARKKTRDVPYAVVVRHSGDRGIREAHPASHRREPKTTPGGCATARRGHRKWSTVPLRPTRVLEPEPNAG